MFICLFIRSFVRSFLPSFAQSSVRSFVCLSVHVSRFLGEWFKDDFQVFCWLLFPTRLTAFLWKWWCDNLTIWWYGDRLILWYADTTTQQKAQTPVCMHAGMHCQPPNFGTMRFRRFRTLHFSTRRNIVRRIFRIEKVVFRSISLSKWASAV